MSFTKLKINCRKIDKKLLFEGKSGTYMDCTLHENKDGEDQYGNAGFISQDVSKEAREKGERGPIIGNYKIVGVKSNGTQAQPTAKAPASAPVAGDSPPDDSDPIPF